MEKDDIEKWAEKGVNKTGLEDFNNQFLNWAVYGVPQTYTVKEGKIFPITEENISESDSIVHISEISVKEVLERYADVLTDEQKNLLDSNSAQNKKEQ